MDNALTNTLAEAIQAIESGAALDVVVARYPAQAEALMSHLGLWSRLHAAPRVEADPAMVSAGKARMMAVLAAPAASSPLPTAALAKAMAVAAGIVLLGTGTAGVSAALGGPDFAGGAFESVGISRGGGSSDASTGSDSNDISTDALDGVTEGGVGDATNPNPDENANPNAFEGCENRDDGIGNANENAGNGVENADPQALDGGQGTGGKCEEEHGGEPQGPVENPGQGQGQGSSNKPDIQPTPRVTPPPHPQGNGNVPENQGGQGGP
jgi:hypothetical protein